MIEVEKIDVGLMRYVDAWSVQRTHFDRVVAGQTDGVLMMVEHPHVYTLGKSGDQHNLLIDSVLMKTIGAEFVKVDRGGDITYHGQGQMVVYPIVDLRKMGVSLRDYIWRLEQTIMDTVATFGVVADRVEGATGVWVDGVRKIAAIGVKASRAVTMHGIALNVTTDLSYFSHINPCGFVDKGVTSLEKECSVGDIERVKATFCAEFERQFNCHLK